MQLTSRIKEKITNLVFKTKDQVKILLNKGKQIYQRLNVSILTNLVTVEINVLRE